MKNNMMKAIVYKKYGFPIEVMKLQEVDKPTPKADEVLIKVKAVSLNASDVEFVKGTPIYTRFLGFSKPKYTIIGLDVAGVIETVGEAVTQFKVEFAKELCVKQSELVSKNIDCLIK